METLNTALKSLTKAHQWSEQNQAISYATYYAGTSFIWYAMPDFCKSRTLRFLGKTAMTISTVTYEKHLGTSSPTYRDYAETAAEVESLKAHLGARTVNLIAAAVVTTGLGLTVFTEKKIHSVGTRRAKAGKKFAHSLPAFFIASATALAGYAMSTNHLHKQVTQ